MAVYDIDGQEVATKYEGAERESAYLFPLTSGNGNQGSCTDGTYLYSAFVNTSKIAKLDILNKTKTEATIGMALDHANDMTYNPTTGKLYVATMDQSAQIAVIDPETLTLDSVVVLHDADGVTLHRCYGLAYDRKRNQYITADSATDGKKYSFFDASFSFIKTITITRNEGFTLQGIETDGTHIFRALWDRPTDQNWIYVHDMEMAYVGRLFVPQLGELEAVAYDWNGNWYATYGTGAAYYLGIASSLSFETAEQFGKIVSAYS
jgi:DNA-binding beta-propeller fold protein YncE